MKWLRWFGWRKKGSYIFSESSMPSQLLCRNNRGGNYKKIFKTKCMNFGATEQLLGHVSGAERWENSFFGSDGGLKVGLTTALITASHRVSHPFCICLSVMTSLDREWERRLGGGSQRRFGKDQTAGERKCWSRKKKKKEVLEKTTMTKKSVCCPTHQLFADDQKLSDIRHHYLLSLWKCKIYCTQVTNKNRQKRRTLSVLFQRGWRSFRVVGGGVCDLQEKNQNQLLTATNQDEGAGTGRGGGAKKNSFIFFQNKILQIKIPRTHTYNRIRWPKVHSTAWHLLFPNLLHRL